MPPDLPCPLSSRLQPSTITSDSCQAFIVIRCLLLNHYSSILSRINKVVLFLLNIRTVICKQDFAFARPRLWNSLRICLSVYSVAFHSLLKTVCLFKLLIHHSLNLFWWTDLQDGNLIVFCCGALSVDTMCIRHRHYRSCLLLIALLACFD